jgi:hypothetical protein
MSRLRRLEFGEGVLDRIEVGTVGWVEDTAAKRQRLRLNYGHFAFVRSEVVHDDHVSGLEIGAPRTMSAIVPINRSAPTKVVVFQWPRGATLNFVPLLTPTNEMTYDAAAFFNSALGLLSAARRVDWRCC